MTTYDSRFYELLTDTAHRSARHIVPMVISYLAPKSVIDIGCGTGAWLSVFAEHGVTDVVGVDGDFVPKHLLQIPVERYVPFDLTHTYHSDRRFDLVVCLEVAEHLPSERARPFVESLVRLAPAVLFSAAIPGQGGTHHINEQWQDYWAALFNSHDYVPIDCVRRVVWQTRDVSWWYSQNCLLYCERRLVSSNDAIAAEYKSGLGLPLNLVHPRKLDEAIWRERLSRGALQLRRLIPEGRSFLLVDDETTADAFTDCGRILRFTGRPPDSQTAMTEMQSLWGPASHVVVVEPAFWWLDFYRDWSAYLHANSQLVLTTDLFKVFEVRAVK